MANTMELDFTGVSSNNFIPEGVHSVVITEATFKKATTGSDQLEVNFQAGDGSVRKAWFSLVPQALWKLKGFLETIGIPCEGKINLNPKSLIRKVCQISVEPDINDPSKLIVSKFNKLANAPSEAPVQSAPAFVPPVQASIPPQVAPTAPASNFPPQAGNNASAGQMNFPSQMMTSPSESQPVAQPEVAPAPAQAPNPAPQGNLPPWMAQAQGNSVPQGNLPPWMKK